MKRVQKTRKLFGEEPELHQLYQNLKNLPRNHVKCLYVIMHHIMTQFASFTIATLAYSRLYLLTYIILLSFGCFLQQSAGRCTSPYPQPQPWVLKNGHKVQKILIILARCIYCTFLQYISFMGLFYGDFLISKTFISN